jgi:heme exporter protein CcmD
MIDFGPYNGYVWPCFIASAAVLATMVIEAVVNLHTARKL